MSTIGLDLRYLLSNSKPYHLERMVRHLVEVWMLCLFEGHRIAWIQDTYVRIASDLSASICLSGAVASEVS